MNWIDYEYPNTAYIVEVKYSGDVTITTCRCNDIGDTYHNIRRLYEMAIVTKDGTRLYLATWEYNAAGQTVTISDSPNA